MSLLYPILADESPSASEMLPHFAAIAVILLVCCVAAFHGDMGWAGNELLGP